MTVQIITGDCRGVLRTLPADSVHCVVTSPPYFGLRDYGVAGQIGLEPSPDEFVAELVAVFAEVRRVLRPDGTLWLNLGDSYANDGKWGGHTGGKHVKALHCSPIGRNKRSIWEVATQPFSESHFATFPTALIEPCILAGCQKGGTVLDPFGGAGTTGMVADRLGRNAILIEINPEYAAMAERRIRKDAGMFADLSGGSS